jgi:UDP-glucose 4-epimerase
MNYRGKVVGLTGANGFIGSQLYKRLEQQGAYINVLTGDVRDPATFAGVNYEYDYVFHFADPSSQVLFKRQPMYAADVTVTGFLNAAKAAREHGAKLVYPSTGLLSQDRGNEYARTKKLSEDIHLGENLDALGLRIFATYGPGEGHKRDYASTPYLFARDMYYGKSPEIWGDGEQKRDFIYIDDVADAVLVLAEEANEPIIDVGSGEPVSFKELMNELKHGWMVNSGAKIPDAVYIDRPAGYVEDTAADPTIMRKYFMPSVTFAEGISRMIKEIQGNAGL